MVEVACAVASRERAEPMFATASHVRRWLLIEVPGAWGRDAIPGAEIGRSAPAGWLPRLKAAGIRPIAIRRDLERRSTGPLQLFYVEIGTGGSWGRSWSRRAGGVADALDATVELPTEGDDRGWVEHHAAIVLVCTNGRHDACCATFGRPLARALRNSEFRDEVWESSHIGGDRFAANLVILPDGLYFGRCDVDAATSVLEAYRRGDIALDHYRGRCAWRFHEQAAEYFVRRQLGLTAIDAIVGVRRLRQADSFAVDVAAEGAPATVHVVVRRGHSTIPVPLTCAGPPGQRVPSYELVSLAGP